MVLAVTACHHPPAFSGYKDALMKVPNDEDRRGNRSTTGEFRNMSYMKNITINLATLQNDTKLATVIKATNNLDIDTLTI